MSEPNPASQDSPQKSVRAILTDLRPVIRNVTTASLDSVGSYGCALRAALVKSFEFAEVVHADPPPDHGFFITPTLRGLCEDLIALSFIARLSTGDRNEVVSLLLAKNFEEGVAAQVDFFKSNRPWQPVVQLPKQEAAATEARLRVLAKSLEWTGRQPWPSVWFMAKASSLAPLYSYIYAATSKWVHFSPHILLRMGWGGSPSKVDRSTEWTFTTSNFRNYYADFNRVYSVMLLLQLIRGPARGIIPSEALQAVSELQTCLDDEMRWPEDVTFEEFNLKGPGTLQRILLRVAHENGNTQSS